MGFNSYLNAGISILLLCCSKIARCESQYLEELSVIQASNLMEKGQLTSERLTRFYLDRIEKYNLKGPKLKAIGQINSNALEQARKLDLLRQSGVVKGLLHGIPVVVKDNIDTADGMATTAGSVVLRNHYADKDAFLIKQLRNAGAVILAKSNMSEWANARSYHASAGWSGLYGQTKNPYDPTRSPCGSSSGSAVAVSANLTSVAVGTETNGSLVCPASMNGIVAIKPTVGLISREGIIPITSSFDTAGPMARTVSDAVILLQAMVSYDDADDSAIKGESDYLQYLKEGGLHGKKVGLVTNIVKANRFTEEIIIRQVEILQSLGATVVPVELNFQYDGWEQDKSNVFMSEYRFGLEKYFKTHSIRDTQSIADLISLNKQHAATEMKFFGQEILHKTLLSPKISTKQYKSALARLKRNIGIRAIDSTLQRHGLDFFVSATLSGPAPKIDLIYGKATNIASVATPAAIAGYPHITLPMGTIHAMPLGLSFWGKRLDEGQLIRAAYSFEQATKARSVPQM